MAANQDNESETRQKLAELPGRNMRCDLLLQVGDHSFPARKDVLMLRMEYFRGMFNAGLQEKNQVIIKFDPEIVDPAAFDDILEYVYTLNITLTTAKLESLYRTADFFCFDELKTKIGSFIKSKINMNNLSVFFDISTKYNLEAQQEECKKFIMANPLLNFNARSAIGYLNFAEFSSHLQKLSSLTKFEEMFHSSIAWILQDEPNRSERISDLLQHIPLRRLSSDFFEQVISKNTIVMNDMKCLQLLFKSAIANPPVEELYVFGGMDGTELSSMSKYDSSTRRWVQIAAIPEKLSNFAFEVANQKIYVCGGHDGQNSINALFMYDTNTHKWSTLKAMKHSRQDCAMAVFSDYLYVAGGSTEECLPIVERYSIKKNKWEEVSPMIHKRQGLELAHLNGFLYALGGHDGTSLDRSVEQYNPLTDKWTLIANMNNFYQEFGSAVLNGRIYVLGEDSFEEYNPEENKWGTLATPTKCESGRRLAAFDRKLYAIGGRIGDLKDWKGIRTVECYGIEKGFWKPAKFMKIGRCHHGVAVVTRNYTPQ